MDRNRTAAHLTRTDGGFKKCCMCSVVDGTDNDMLWNGSEGNWDVRSECEEEESTDYEDGDSDTDW